jgi:hypothetical protein
MSVYKSMDVCISICTRSNSSILLSDPSNPLHLAFCLVHPVIDIPLKGVVPLGELGRGRGYGSVAWPRATMRIV